MSIGNRRNRRWMMCWRHAPWTACLALAALGCGDDAKSPSAVLVPTSQAAIEDGGINTADSYFSTYVTASAEMSVDTNEAFLDPVTEQPTNSFSYSTSNYTTYVEGGYDYSGQTHLNTRVLDEPSNDLAPDQRVTYLTQVNDAATDYLASGNSVSAAIADNSAMSVLGTMAGVNFEGVAGYNPPSGGGGTCTHSCEEPTIRLDGATTHVRRAFGRDGSLRITRESTGPRLTFATLASPANENSVNKPGARKTKEERLYKHDGGGSGKRGGQPIWPLDGHNPAAIEVVLHACNQVGIGALDTEEIHVRQFLHTHVLDNQDERGAGYGLVYPETPRYALYQNRLACAEVTLKQDQIAWHQSRSNRFAE